MFIAFRTGETAFVRFGATAVALAVVFVLLMPAAGCVRVQSRTAQRGELLRTTPLRKKSDVASQLVIGRGAVARVANVTTTCTLNALEYARVEHQEIARPDFGQIFFGQTLGAFGVAALVTSFETPVHEGSDLSPDLTLAAGIFLVSGSLYATISELVSKPKRSERVVRLRDPERIEETSCVDALVPVAAEQVSKISLGGVQRIGVSRRDGRLALVPEVLAVLDELPAEKSARLVARDSLALVVWLGDASPKPVELAVDLLPNDWWARWAAQRAPTLPDEQRARWDACHRDEDSIRKATRCLVGEVSK